MSLKMSKKVPKMAQKGLKWVKMGQNGSKMDLKWPHWAILGHFGPILGVLGAFSANLGLLDVILDQYAAAGTSHAHNCAS